MKHQSAFVHQNRQMHRPHQSGRGKGKLITRAFEMKGRGSVLLSGSRFKSLSLLRNVHCAFMFAEDGAHK